MSHTQDTDNVPAASPDAEARPAPVGTAEAEQKR